MQWVDWPWMCRQSGLQPVIDRLSKSSGGKVSFRDLRKEVFRRDANNFLVPSDEEHGDPRGYREVGLGPRSHLEDISDQSEKFSVNDYGAAVTSNNRRKGSHLYLVSQSVLDADLFINLPKWKSHQKSGLTGALKNLVGINGYKAYLPHFRRGAPKWGDDEYRDENRRLYFAQTALREKFQKKSSLAYKLLKPGTAPRNFYIAGGAWHGNETVWRMIYDLNLIILCADANGQLYETPQRQYFCIVDGLVSGEGNGPLQPLPCDTDWLVFGDDPFAIDAALSWFMGFAPEKIQIIARRQQFTGPEWGTFDLNELQVQLDGQITKLIDCLANFHSAPPPGWGNYIEP